MAECIEKERVVEWFRPYGHEDDGIPYDVLVADIRDMPAADVVPIEALKRLRDELYDMDLITMEGLRRLNPLIRKYTMVHEGGDENA